MSTLQRLAAEIRSSATKPDILLHLLARKEDTVSGIARAISKDKSTVSRHLRKLRQLELVSWEQGSLDKKKKIYSLTERGKQLSSYLMK